MGSTSSRHDSRGMRASACVHFSEAVPGPSAFISLWLWPDNSWAWLLSVLNSYKSSDMCIVQDLESYVSLCSERRHVI